jgi:hypothetical protein
MWGIDGRAVLSGLVLSEARVQTQFGERVQGSSYIIPKAREIQRNLAKLDIGWTLRGDVSFPYAPRVGPKFDLFNELNSLNMLTNYRNGAHSLLGCGSQARSALRE